MSSNARAPVPLHKHCDLMLRTPLQADRPAFLCAASGLVCGDRHFYVVADDELHLGIFPFEPNRAGDAYTLQAGELPAAPKPRKQHKPDFEVLTHLGATRATRSPMLLVLGSGSRPNRATGLLLALDTHGELQPDAAAIAFDLGELYRALEREFAIVNIEGATVRGDELLLLQRGNKSGKNAIVSLELEFAVEAMQQQRLDASALRYIHTVELGSHADVALGFTDAMTLDGSLLALAVAEDTDDPYLDGETSASYVCRFDAQHRLQAMIPLAAPAKTEGIARWPRAATETLAFVTDADDASIPSALLTAPLDAFL